LEHRIVMMIRYRTLKVLCTVPVVARTLLNPVSFLTSKTRWVS
jgi:hypothetical protein